MVNSVDFTKRLEKIMKFYGLSATAFSEAIDFNRSTISHLLSGRNKPSLEFVMKVVQTFPEVELYWLLKGKGSFPVVNNEKGTHDVYKTDSSEKIINKNIQASEETNTFNEQNETIESKKIDRIVVFYSDGTFKSYKD